MSHCKLALFWSINGHLYLPLGDFRKKDAKGEPLWIHFGEIHI